MSTAQRILLAHDDAQMRRWLANSLADAGLRVTAVEPNVAALAPWAGEAFDVILLGRKEATPDAFSLCPRLRGDHEATPIIMLLPELHLPLVVQGIRHGLSDVLPLREDPRPVVRRVCGLLHLEPSGEPTAAELEEVEASLAQLDPNAVEAARDPVTRAERERLWQGLKELHLEREVIAAAQAGMDEKARLLHAEREELRRERRRLEVESSVLREEGADLERGWRELAQQKERLLADRRGLARVEDDLRRRERTLHETLPPWPVHRLESRSESVPAWEQALAEEWERLERERTAFEAERAVYRDECMVLSELERQIREKEARLRDLAAQVADLDRQRRGLPHPPPAALAKPALVSRAEPKPGLFKSLLGRGPRARKRL